jgi:hypothetical protein
MLTRLQLSSNKLAKHEENENDSDVFVSKPALQDNSPTS